MYKLCQSQVTARNTKFGPINEITLEMASVKQSKAFIDEGEEEVRAEKLGI